MKKFFAEHANITLTLVVFFSLIGLAGAYGASGGTMDTIFKGLFDSIKTQNPVAVAQMMGVI